MNLGGGRAGTKKGLWLCVCVPALVAVLLAASVPVAQAAFPGKNGKIAFSNYLGGGSWVETIEPDGSGRSPLLQGTDPAWSADGTRLAFAFGNNISTANSDGSEVVQVTHHSPCDPSGCGYSSQPAFSPDGTMIAKNDAYCGGHFCYGRVSRINVDGSGEFILADDAGWPSWSPDGTKIALHSYGWIFVVSPNANQATLTDNGYDTAPNWSPDGTRIVFNRFIPEKHSTEIYVMNADGTNQIAITDNNEYDIDPAWSPDGTRIVYSKVNTDVDGHPRDLHTMRTDGSDDKNITNSPSIPEYYPDWQPLPNQPPDCSAVTASPSSLGHHGFQTVTLAGAIDPDGDAVTITIDGVTQDEPVGRLPDARAGASPNQVVLRGRRWNKDDGRVYRIAFTVSDGTDECSGVATVEVRRKKKEPAVDSAPPSYDSFAG